MILQRLSLSTAIFAAVIAMANADPNMRFHGELIDEPCVIKPGHFFKKSDKGTIAGKP